VGKSLVLTFRRYLSAQSVSSKSNFTWANQVRPPELTTTASHCPADAWQPIPVRWPSPGQSRRSQCELRHHRWDMPGQGPSAILRARLPHGHGILGCHPKHTTNVSDDCSNAHRQYSLHRPQHACNQQRRLWHGGQTGHNLFRIIIR
jgi:hypothetical protein